MIGKVNVDELVILTMNPFFAQDAPVGRLLQEIDPNVNDEGKVNMRNPVEGKGIAGLIEKVSEPGSAMMVVLKLYELIEIVEG